MAEEDSQLIPLPDLREIAHIKDGRDFTRTFIEPLLRPQDELLLQKAPWDYLKLWEYVLEDDQVKTTLQQRFSALKSKETEVILGKRRGMDTTTADEKARDFIKEQIEGLSWDDHSEKMAYGVFYGMSFGECMWMRDGSNIVFDDTRGGILVRNRRRFRFDIEKRPRLITLADQMFGELLPDRKFWMFQVGADNDDEPFGKGLAHWLYWPVFFKRSDIRLWLKWVESEASGKRVGKYPKNASKKDQDTLLEAAYALGSSGAVVIPEGMLLELQQQGRSSTPDYATLHDKMNASITKVVLSQTMTTEDGGSYSQAKVHEGVLESVIKADSDLINQSFNRGPVRWLIDWNYPGAAYPQVWRRVESEPDLKPQADRDKTLFDMGFRPRLDYVKATYGEGFTDTQAPAVDENGQPIEEDVKTPLYQGLGATGTEAMLNFLQATKLPRENALVVLQEIFGIPPEVGEQMLPQEGTTDNNPPTNPIQVGGVDPANPLQSGGVNLPFAGAVSLSDALPGQNPAFAEGTIPTQSTTVEKFVEKLRKKAQPEFEKMFSNIRQLLNESEDLVAFQEKLDAAYPDLDGETLTAVMAEAMFASRLAGIFEAQEE